MNTIKVTWEDLELLKTKKGGYSKSTIKKCGAIVGSTKGFVKKLYGMEVDREVWDKIINPVQKAKIRKEKRKKKKEAKAINAVSTIKTDFWKPEKNDIPSRKRGNNGKNKTRKEMVCNLTGKDFYKCDEWRSLRIRVLEKYECKCMMCGRSPKNHGIVIHVDHIKPRSRHPELSLDFDNLQLLCEDCNLGKSNKYQTDWRPTNV